VILILIPVVTGFFGEKGKQLAEPVSTLKPPTQPNNQQTEKQSGDIHQTAAGDGNIQLVTTGDNSPIIINARKEEFSYKIQAKQIYYNKAVDSLFITKVELYSQQLIPNVYFAAYAKSIIKFEVRPQRTGMHMGGHSGKREDFWFTNIPDFGGKYLLVVKTKKSEKIKIEYDFEQTHSKTIQWTVTSAASLCEHQPLIFILFVNSHNYNSTFTF
jgi:hypothetical protein